MTISTQAEFESWTLEKKLVEDELARLELAERAALLKMRCPTDLATIYAILNGEAWHDKHGRRHTAPPWTKRSAARDRKRALHAMHTLAQIERCRADLGLVNGNPRLAAHAALLAGLLANDAATKAVLATQVTMRRRKGGQTRGAQLTRVAAKHDAEIKKYEKRWRVSDELQEDYRSAAAYVMKMTGLPRKTIERRLSKLRQ